MSIKEKTETEEIIEERIKESGATLTPAQSCQKVAKKSSMTAYILLFVLIGTTIPIGIGLYYGMDTVIDIKIDMTNMVVAPNSTIKACVDESNYPVDDEFFASIDNASFQPYGIAIMLLTDTTVRWFQVEYTFGQVPARMQDRVIYAEVAGLESYTDFYLGGSTFFLRIDQNTTYNIQMRTSSDYYILVKMVMYVNFTDPNAVDRYISFVYSEGHGVFDLTGRALGRTAFPLERGKTTFFNITGFYYDYQYINQYFDIWNDPNDVPAYPFILNATRTTKFDWNTYWGVKQ